MSLNELKIRAYEIACEHGWHEKKLSDETYLMLIITEIAEAVNADRNGKHANISMFNANCNTLQVRPERHWKYIYELFIKNSVEDELADVVIRCLSFAGLHGWDLQHALDNMQSVSDTAVVIGDEAFAETAFSFCEEIFDVRFSTFSEKEAMLSVLVNVVEYCNYKGIDLWWYVEQKMRYNELRSYRHGGKAY